MIEEGLNGRTTVFHDALMPYANGMDYLPACLLTHNPVDLVIFNLGTNDLKRHVCNNIGATGQGMAMLIQKTREILGAQQKILVISPVEISDDRLNLGPMILLDQGKPEAEQAVCGGLSAHSRADGLRLPGRGRCCQAGQGGRGTYGRAVPPQPCRGGREEG